MVAAVRALVGSTDSARPPVRGPVEDHEARLTNPKRLAALALTGLMDEEADAAFDRFTKLASRFIVYRCGRPVHRELIGGSVVPGARASPSRPWRPACCRHPSVLTLVRAPRPPSRSRQPRR